MSDVNALSCPCDCHGKGTYATCSVDGGCGYLHKGACLCCTADMNDRYRWACPGCVDTMRRRLREIETYAAMLPHMLEPMRDDAARRAPGFSSAPPLRIEAAVALDKRSRPGASVDRDWDPEIDDPEHTSSILSALHSMARWIREEQQIPEPVKAPTIVREVGYLLGAIEWSAHQQWVDDLFEEIRRLHAQDRRLAKDVPPGPLGGGCLTVTCNGQVFWVPDITDPEKPGETLDAARCDSCNRLYYGTDLVRLKLGRREAS